MWKLIFSKCPKGILFILFPPLFLSSSALLVSRLRSPISLRAFSALRSWRSASFESLGGATLDLQNKEPSLESLLESLMIIGVLIGASTVLSLLSSFFDLQLKNRSQVVCNWFSFTYPHPHIISHPHGCCVFIKGHYKCMGHRMPPQRRTGNHCVPWRQERQACQAAYPKAWPRDNRNRCPKSQEVPRSEPMASLASLTHKGYENKTLIS